jgi:hypothetical protein
VALTRTLQAVAAQYRRASAATRDDIETRLVAAAEARRAFLASIMDGDPGAVLQAVLSAATRSGLPSVLTPYLEQDAELQGTLEILHEDRTDGARYHYRLHSARGRLSLHFADHPPEHLVTGVTVRVRGIQIDDMLALDGGGGASVQQVAPAPALNALGEQRTIVLLINFTDNASRPYEIADAQAALFGTTSAFFRENSYDQTWLAGSVAGWFTIPVSATTCDYDAIASSAQAAATAAGVSLSGYTHQVYAFPQNTCGWWGLSTVGGNPSRSWINGPFELGVLAHELGHGHGLWHSHALDCGNVAVVGSNCATNEYGDIADMMGASHVAHYNAYQKERLGWLNSGVSPPITTVAASGTYAIEPYESRGTGPKALKILKATDSSTGARTWYYIEARQPIGFDGFIADPSAGAQDVAGGVVVHMGTEGNGNSAFLLDMTPATPVYYWWYDFVLAAGQTFTDPVTGVSFTTSWVGPTGAGISVNVPPVPPVSAPAITLSTNQTVYTRGQTASIAAKVTSGGKAVARASVNFVVIKANGARVSASATTGNNGIATYKLRLSNKDPVGLYRADATATGKGATAETTFSVQ